VVAVQIDGWVRTHAHRHALFAEVIILERIPVRDFIVIADIESRCAARDFFHTISIAVVCECCRCVANYNTRQPIFLVIR